MGETVARLAVDLRRGLGRYRAAGACLVATLVVIAAFPPADPPEEVVAAPGQGGAVFVEPERDFAAALPTEPGAQGPTTTVGAPGTTTLAAEPGAADPGAGEAAALPPNCDPATGRIRFPSVFAPPCVMPVADNGGATYPGVTEDEILLAVYVPQEDPLIGPILAQLGVTDTAEQVEDTWYDLLDMFQSHYETYGRQVRLVVVDASGPPDDRVAARADAVRVATRIQPFAVLASLAPKEFNQELTSRGVVVLNLLQYPQSWWEDAAPYMWGTQMSCDQAGLMFGQYIGRKLAHQRAVHAGDAAFHELDRSFGLIILDDEDGINRPCADTLERELGTHGVALADRITYQLDPALLQEQASVILARLKSRGVTSILFYGDFLAPITFTQEATRQGYFPEWVIPGGNLLDSIYTGRLYDQRQWRNAFGLSTLWIRPPQELTEVYYQYVWHHGHPPHAKITYEILYQDLWLLLTGIHMAGPNLTPHSFRDGLFAFPASGGGVVSAVQRSFGRNGGWPFDVYTAFDTVAEIWWDPEAVGPDETGQVDSGMWRWVDGGHRYGYGQWPSTPSRVFDPVNAPSHLDALPESDRFPEYPRPG